MKLSRFWVGTAALLTTGFWASDQGVLASSENRVSGSDQYSIAVEVARLAGGGSLEPLTDLIITSGETYPDALSAAGLASYLDTCSRTTGRNCGQTAILLTRRDALPNVTAIAIREAAISPSRITVIGGPSSVSESTHAAIARAAGWNGSGANPIRRIGGDNRYDTSAAVVEHVLAASTASGGTPLPDTFRTVVIATGEDFADAVNAGSYAYRLGHLLMLTPRDSVPTSVLAAVSALEARCIVVVGGTEAVSAKIVDTIEASLTTEDSSCETQRILGSDRYDTAARVATRVHQSANSSSRTRVMLASGNRFADSLTTSVLGRRQVLLLTTSTQLAPPAKKWIDTNRNTIEAVQVIGSDSAIAPGVVAEAVQTAAPAPMTPPSNGSSTPSLAISYASTAFSSLQSGQTVSATVTGGSGTKSFSVSGTLPAGVSFDATTGAFTGPSSWSLSATKVAGGGEHTCALTTSGGMKCWGRNLFGQLGTNDSNRTPKDVVGLTSGVVDIATGTDHSCAVTSSGGVKCWGSNGNGRLGDGTGDNRSTPITVLASAGVDLTGAAAVTAGHEQTCVLTSSGGVKCWGNGGGGRLGDGTGNQSSYPVDVRLVANGATLSGVVQVSTGNAHTCALLDTGAVKCWGENNAGQLGTSGMGFSYVPVDVRLVLGGATLSGVTQISSHWNHTCALLGNGTVKCWGQNDAGQLGNGTTTNSNVAVDVTVSAGSPLSGAIGVTTGEGYSCALMSGGGVKCWGANSDGRLGDGTTVNRPQPTDVTTSAGVPLTGISKIDGGQVHVCAIDTLGALRCWGNGGSWRLGDGNGTNSTVAVNVTGFAGSAGWPATVTVTVTDDSGSASVTLTLTSS